MLGSDFLKPLFGISKNRTIVSELLAIFVISMFLEKWLFDYLAIKQTASSKIRKHMQCYSRACTNCIGLNFLSPIVAGSGPTGYQFSSLNVIDAGTFLQCLFVEELITTIL